MKLLTSSFAFAASLLACATGLLAQKPSKNVLGKADAEPFEREAKRFGVDLQVVDLKSDEARELYAAELALVRPDQVVAWRGNDARAAANVLARLTGRG